MSVRQLVLWVPAARQSSRRGIKLVPKKNEHLSVTGNEEIPSPGTNHTDPEGQSSTSN